MKAILIAGAVLFVAVLIWGLVAGAHEDEDDDEKEFSGLLEEDD